ncbi:PD-(D/E)XK motif protein [Gordonia sp. CPCC 206044]|uniref:PD-(D/E)XK motif protein n=1 Tax=Gordonia sp. CPCC 206044 TaxID=3140793 RepID=UPI003AF36C37
MTPSSSDARHLSLTTLDELWASGAPIELPVVGDPACRLQLDPENRLLRLVTEFSRPEPDLAKFRNIRFDAYTSGREEFGEITVRVERSAHGAYSLLADVADGLQIRKVPLAVAVSDALGRHRDVIANRGALTLQREVGLFGELLFLDFLMHTIGAGPALAAWQGPVAEEHDFVFETVHVEIKCTSSEQRKHVIHGLGQLVPAGDAPLMVLSIQLTRGAPNSGRTLSELIAQVRNNAAGHSAGLDAALEASGWAVDDADLYPTVWELRSEPRAYVVGEEFPALTPDRVARVVPNAGLLSDVSYAVDLTGVSSDPLPEPMSGFAGLGEG